MLDIDVNTGTLQWNDYAFQCGLTSVDLISHCPVSTLNGRDYRLGSIQFDGREHEFIFTFVEHRLRVITFQPDLRDCMGDVNLDHLEDYNPAMEEVVQGEAEWEQSVELWRLALAAWLEAKIGKPHQVSETHTYGLRLPNLQDWTYQFPWGKIMLQRGFLDSCHKVIIAYNS